MIIIRDYSRSTAKHAIIITVILLVASFSSCSLKKDKFSKKTEKNRTSENKPESENDSTYSVIMVGDIMMGTNYQYDSSLPPDDGRHLFDDVSELLPSADVSLGNLEGTLLDKGGTPKVCNDSFNNCVIFRMPERYAGYLRDAGFDIMSVANNHSGDMGETGRKSTANTLERYGLEYAGYTFCPTTIYIKDGISFGFAAFAPNTGTQDLLDIESAAKVVEHLRANCNIVIVYFHGGAEGTSATRVPRRMEYYLGEKRGDVYKFAHEMVNAGADVVFGSGPHVARGIELYKDRIVAYSLGNFCTYGKFALSGALGLAPVLKVYIDKSGKFKHGRIYPYKQLKRGFPVFDDEHKVVGLVKNLTEKDFPESGLIIQGDGRVEKK